MTDQAFEALVSRLEREARGSPSRYQWKVVGLALLGNAYLAGVVALVVGAACAALAALSSVVALPAMAAKLLPALGVVALLLVKAMWVKLEVPRGTPLSRSDSPELFASIDRLRQAMRAPRFHRVLLTDEFNASVMQIPRLGILGWPRNYLLVGLPLLKAMRVRQFEAVVAHEVAHLAHGHGRLANWVYTQRLRWTRLVSELDQHASRASWLVKPFLKRFAPYFNAYSFPLARANEYLADAAAARVTSPAAIADALTGVAVVGSYLSERYWQDIVRHADSHPSPAFAPHAGLGAALVQDLDPRAIKGYMQRALAGRTGTSDTHPALHDRLEALRDKPRLRLPRDGEAADRLLGAALPELTQAFDKRWRESIATAWSERFNAVKAGRECLAELDRRHSDGEPLSRREAFERAQLTADVGQDHDEAIAQLRALVASDPDEVTAIYALGARLLARDDDMGLACMERAMVLDEFAIVHALEHMRDHHARDGDDDAARACQARLIERSALEGQAHHERSRFLPGDQLDEHDLSPETVQALREQLRDVDGLRFAYIARKRVQHLAHRPCYVLAFGVSPWWTLRVGHARRVDRALAQLEARLCLPGETILLCIESEFARFRGQLGLLSNTKLR